MTVRELEEAYQQLRDQLLSGEPDEEDLRASIEPIRFQGEVGLAQIQCLPGSRLVFLCRQIAGS
jgi:predicted ATPase